MGKKDKRQINTLGREKLNNSEQNQNRNFQIFLAIVACIILPFIIYSNSLHTPFIFDDIQYIVENPRIKLSDKWETKKFYDDQYTLHNVVEPARPLTFLTFALNYKIGGLNTFGYHLFNVILHVFNTILLFILSRKIISIVLKEQSVFLALAISLLFSVHPINTEVVTYISHRSEGLCMIFYMLALYLFIKTVERSKWYYPLSLISFVLSIYSKEVGATLPAIILGLDYLIMSDLKADKIVERKYFHIPYWIILVIFLFLRHMAIGIGTGRADTQIVWSNYSYFVTQIYVVTQYIKLLIIPMGQCIDHFIQPIKTVMDFRVLISLFSLCGIFWGIFLIFIKNAYYTRLVVFSIFWFLIALTPTSSFLPIDDAMAERRIYLPSWGFYLIAVILYLKITNTITRNNQIANIESANKKKLAVSRKILLVILIIHIAILSILTWKRNEQYKQALLMWKEAILRYPDNFRAWEAAATLYHENKEYDKALELYQKAIELNPKFALAHYNLGNLYNRRKEYDKALQSYQKTIILKPEYANAYYNMGFIYQGLEQYEEAEKLYEKANEIDPNSVDVNFNLAKIYYEQKKYDDALLTFEKVVKLDPNISEAFGSMGLIYYQQQKYDKAELFYRKALELKSDNIIAHYNYGILLFQKKDYKKALEELKIARNLTGNDNFAQNEVTLIKNLLSKQQIQKKL